MIMTAVGKPPGIDARAQAMINAAKASGASSASVVASSDGSMVVTFGAPSAPPQQGPLGIDPNGHFSGLNLIG